MNPSSKYEMIPRQITCSVIMLLWMLLPAHGQEHGVQDADQMLNSAKSLAFETRYDESLSMLEELMALEPGYLDARVLYARIYAWRSQFDTARSEINKVLALDPGQKDAIELLINIEYWSGQLETALIVIDGALRDFQDDDMFQLQRARILNELGRFNDAAGQLARLTVKDPGNSQALALLKQIRKEHLANSVTLFYGVDVFSEAFRAAHYSSVQVSRTTVWGNAMARLNFAHRFERSGVQPEIELYPKLTKNIYLYVDYAYSASILFPKNRIGLEGNFRLPENFEASAGFRLLDFQSSNVIIITGSAGVYFGSYWISIRPYVTRTGPTTDLSSSLTLRRYFKNPLNYIGVYAAAGFSPDERRVQSSVGFSQDGIFSLASQRVGVTSQQALRGDWTVDIGLYASHQETSFDHGNFIWISSSTITIRKKF